MILMMENRLENIYLSISRVLKKKTQTQYLIIALQGLIELNLIFTDFQVAH